MLKAHTSKPGFSADECIRDFFRKSSRSMPVSDPLENVQYPQTCGALCRNRNSLRSAQFHAKVLGILHQIVKEHSPSVRHVPDQGLIFAAEQYVESSVGAGQPDCLSFYAICAAAGKQAHHRPQVTLAQLDVQHGACAVWLAMRPCVCDASRHVAISLET